MNTTENALLELIKKSQFGIDFIPQHDCDYSAVLHEAKQQSVLGLVCQFIPPSAFPEGKEWQHIVERQRFSLIRYLHEQNSIKHAFDEVGIPFVVLKGCASAIYYADPSKRSMGDIDLLVSKEDYEKAKKILLSGGYYIHHEEDTRNIALKNHSVIVELHRQFSAVDKDIEKYVNDGMKRSELHSIEGFTFPMLPRLSNGLVLLEHMRQHLKGGLGLRQIIDWMMYVHSELDDDFWNESFRDVAVSEGLDKLAAVVTKMCQKHMGLSKTITWPSFAEEELCDELLANIFQSGNFGSKQGQGRNVEAVTAAIKREGLFRRLQKSGEHNWRAYKKHHWLKPICWIYQACRYMKQGRETGRSIKQIMDDTNRGKQRAELIKKLGGD